MVGYSSESSVIPYHIFQESDFLDDDTGAGDSDYMSSSKKGRKRSSAKHSTAPSTPIQETQSSSNGGGKNKLNFLFQFYFQLFGC